VSAQNLTLALKFSTNRGLSAPNFVFLEENFSIRSFFDTLKFFFRGGVIAPPCPDATV